MIITNIGLQHSTVETIKEKNSLNTKSFGTRRIFLL